MASKAEWEAKRNALEAEYSAAGAALKTFPRQANGLPPEAVRITPEYQAARARLQRAFAALRAHNETKPKMDVTDEKVTMMCGRGDSVIIC